jgi:pyruvate dehydrogenase E1 component alpha subunit
MTATGSKDSAPAITVPQSLRLPESSVLQDMLRTMVRIRLFEERVLADYLARKVPGFTHSYLGEEAVATGVCAALQRDDYVTSTHRGHGHAIAKGVGLDAMMAELYGKATGVCGGRGGSMHIADFSLGMLGANGIVGGGFGIAAGAALSAVFRGSPQVAVCFFGDGGINKGTFHEALNFAAVRRLPVVYVCENNQFAQYTAVERTTPIQDLSIRAVAFGMPGIRVDGNNVLEVHAASRDAVDRARRGEGPSLIVCETYRFQGHSVGDAEVYRTREEVAARKRLDPIPRYEAWLIEQGVLDETQRAAVWSQVAAEVEESVEYALASPEPDPATATQELFSDRRPSWSRS